MGYGCGVVVVAPDPAVVGWERADGGGAVGAVGVALDANVGVVDAADVGDVYDEDVADDDGWERDGVMVTVMLVQLVILLMTLQMLRLISLFRESGR